MTKGELTKGELTKKRILEAAVSEFSEHGFEGARIARIAGLARINKERIYANFGNKEELFIEVWKQTYQLSVEDDRYFLELTDADIPDMGKIILTRYMNFHEKHPEFWKIFAWKNLLNEKYNYAVKGLKLPIYTHLNALYEKGQAQGVFNKKVSFQTFMFVIISVSFTFASNKSTMSETLGLDFTSDDAKSTYLHECIDMLFN